MDFENRSRSFTTEYRGNYVRHKSSPMVKYRTNQEFKDPIAESFKDYLSTCEENEEKTENCNHFMQRIKEPKMKERYFQETIKTDLVNKIKENEKDTTYHDHFCTFDGHEKFLPSIEDKVVTLPEGWVKGDTTQRFAYRNPVILFPNIYKKRPNMIIAPSEMDDVYKHSIKSKNVTELEGTIGALGKFIMDNEMHGKIEKITF